MSRSRRKTPIRGITSASSDAQWKARAARRLRRTIRVALNSNPATCLLALNSRETTNSASSDKDGKLWFGTNRPELMRK